MINRMIKPISSLTILLLPFALWAQEGASLDALAEFEEQEQPELRRYRVEVVIFSYTEDAYVGTEVFVPELLELPDESLEPLLDEDSLPVDPVEGPIVDDSVPQEGSMLQEEVVELDRFGFPVEYDENGEPIENSFQFELLVEEDMELTDTVAMLDRLDAYQPLMHFGWVQTTIPEEETPELALIEFGEVPETLEGTLKLYLSRYLHLVVDLSLAAPEDEQPQERGFLPYPDEVDTGFDSDVPTFGDTRPQYEAPPMYAPLRYEILEDRILKNGETRYYDHPKFGVIARVARVEQSEDEEGLDESAESGVVSVQ